MNMRKNVWATAIFVGLAIGVTAPALAQDYPTKPIKIVVPSAAGGSWDREARLLQPVLSEKLGVPIVVINISGGGPAIGIRDVKDEDPDGYTILIAHIAIATTYSLGQTDFTDEALEPVVQTSHDGVIGMVAANSPWKTANDLVAAAKAAPATFLFGANIGGVGHFAPLLFAIKAGIEFRFVQTGGQGTANAALMGGQVQATQTTVSGSRSLIESGDMRPLWVMSAEREPLLPDIPTAKEQGIDAVFGTDIWWFAPKGTPNDRLEKLRDAFEAAMNDPRIIEAYKMVDMTPAFMRGPALEEKIKTDFATVVELAKTAGLYKAQ